MNKNMRANEVVDHSSPRPAPASTPETPTSLESYER